MSGTLYVVATPIGNLDDLTPRARQTLAAVDLVAAEDTRHTLQLLSHFGIETPLLALHDHNENETVGKLVEQLSTGISIALVSDAGTPLISDPGFRLVRAAHAANIDVKTVPGTSAVTAALSVSGLPTDRFCFEGFLPSKRAARLAALRSLSQEMRTMVFFEAVHRIDATLADMIDVFGESRPAYLGRELTKLHEQSIQATLGQLSQKHADGVIASKGEFVIAVAGSTEPQTSAIEIDRLLADLSGTLPARDVARIVARATGAKRNELYQRLLELKGA